MLRLLLAIFTFIGIGFEAHALCVKTAKANLRTGPSSKKPISWTVGKYTPLMEVRRQGSWIEVEDMDGEKHWVHKSVVTNSIVCVSVQVNSARLRKSPGTNAETADIRQVDRYTAFKRIDAQGEWYEVQAGWGEIYWIHESTVWRPVRVTRLSY